MALVIEQPDRNNEMDSIVRVLDIRDVLICTYRGWTINRRRNAFSFVVAKINRSLGVLTN
jgi:hypothetical protein